MLIIGLVLIGAGMLMCIVAAIVDVIVKRQESKTRYSNNNRSTRSYYSSKRYSISQSDFESIAYKCCKRIKRIVNVEVDGSFVNLSIESQSGMSKWDAQLMFELSGAAEFIGDYTVLSDNEDSNIPESIGKRIKAAILENVGII